MRRRLRALARRLERARPGLERRAARALAPALRVARLLGRLAAGLARVAAVALLRALAALERILRRAGAALARAATAGSRVLTQRRGACAVVVASAACLIVAQFAEYRGVEVGRPGYAGLPAVAAPPTVAGESAGDAHAYALLPLAVLAAALGVMALRPERRGLARIVIAIGLASIAVALLVDLPAGLDEGPQEARFAGAHAVLEEGFFAQLAAAAGLILGGLVYYARPCRIRINSFARAASALRRRLPRRGSSRARAARRRSRRRSAAGSAPASPR